MDMTEQEKSEREKLDLQKNWHAPKKWNPSVCWPVGRSRSQ